MENPCDKCIVKPICGNNTDAIFSLMEKLSKCDKFFEYTMDMNKSLIEGEKKYE